MFFLEEFGGKIRAKLERIYKNRDGFCAAGEESVFVGTGVLNGPGVEGQLQRTAGTAVPTMPQNPSIFILVRNMNQGIGAVFGEGDVAEAVFKIDLCLAVADGDIDLGLLFAL